MTLAHVQCVAGVKVSSYQTVWPFRCLPPVVCYYILDKQPVKCTMLPFNDNFICTRSVRIPQTNHLQVYRLSSSGLESPELHELCCLASAHKLHIFYSIYCNGINFVNFSAPAGSVSWGDMREFDGREKFLSVI